MEVRSTGKHDFHIMKSPSSVLNSSERLRTRDFTATGVTQLRNSSSTTDFGVPVHSWLSKDYQISVRLGQEKTLTSWAAGWGAETTLS